MELVDILKSAAVYIRDTGKWNMVTESKMYYKYMITMITLLHDPQSGFLIYQKTRPYEIPMILNHRHSDYIAAYAADTSAVRIFEESDFVEGYSVYDLKYIKTFINNVEKYNDKDKQKYKLLLEYWSNYYPIDIMDASIGDWNLFVMKYYYNVIVKKGLDIMKKTPYFVQEYGHSEESQFFLGLMFFSDEDITF